MPLLAHRPKVTSCAVAGAKEAGIVSVNDPLAAAVAVASDVVLQAAPLAPFTAIAQVPGSGLPYWSVMVPDSVAA